MYEGQGQTKAERIMGQDKTFVMATQNTGLGQDAPLPMPHLRSIDSTILNAALQGSKLRHKVLTQSLC